MSEMANTPNLYNLRKKRLKKRKRIRFLMKLSAVALIIVIGCIIGVKSCGKIKTKERLDAVQGVDIPDWIDVQLIDKHGSARSGVMLSNVKNIVIHYVGNPGTTAQNNRDYFNKSDTEVSSHFLIGLDGEIIQCVPIDEKSAASNWRNSDTISIEVCHPDETGKFNEATYNSLVKLTSWICNLCELDEDDVIRHYDITGKLCPLYYVEHEDAFTQLKKDIGADLDEIKKQGKQIDR